MKSKEFIRGLMAYIKEHYQHPDAVFLKEELKFKQGKYEYAYLAFEHSNIACFITPDCATVRPPKRLFRAVDTRPAVGKLAAALDAVLRSHPHTSDIEWQDG